MKYDPHNPNAGIMWEFGSVVLELLSNALMIIAVLLGGI